jgi:hypothetical protein
LKTAGIDVGRDDAHSQAALEKARVALASIRRFEGRIEDPRAWKNIHDRADDLEAALREFENSHWRTG